MTQKVKKLNDAAIPRLTEISDDALVTVVDKTTGSVSNIEYSKLKAQIIGSLQIGGRNYLPDSEKEIGNAVGGGTQVEFVRYANGSATKEAFDKIGAGQVMLSFEAKSILNPGQIQIYSTPGLDTSFKYRFNTSYIELTNEWQRFEIPLTLRVTYPDAANAALCFYGYPYGSGIIPHVRKIKLERGNVATDWTPAPEDIEARLQVLENQTKVGGGVKLLFTTLCVVPSIRRKGGQRHEQDEKGDGGNACRLSAESDGLQRYLSESRYGDSARSIHHVGRHGLRESTYKHGHILEICHGGGVFPEQCHIRKDYGTNRNGLPIYTQWREEALGCDSLAERKEVVAA